MKTSLQKQLSTQKKNQWNIDSDIPWEQSIDSKKEFLPIAHLPFSQGLSSNEKSYFSQFLGILAIKTISDHERILQSFKKVSFEKSINETISPDLYKLGEEFFIEEAKHANMFDRFIENMSQ